MPDGLQHKRHPDRIINMPPQAPQTPSQQFDFITQNGQPSKKGSGLPLPHLPKLDWIILGAVLGVIILVIIVSSLSGNKSGNSQNYLVALARGQEIIRVSTSIGQLTQDTPTQNLSATVQNSLTSEQAQLTSYLAGQKIKVSTVQLAADKNSNTDTQMQTASTNGNLSGVYASYLKAQLAVYETDLQQAYKNAGPKGKVILSSAYNSAQVILQSSQVADAT